ncbi:MAG TPA: riboflavin synthase [Nitrolancea sp.]|nr:riboflavin synthase [Nitrolancea sp.]
MFSGIVEEIGHVVSLNRGGGDNALSVRCTTVLAGTRIGDSISVNGVCLTVTDLRNGLFVANLQPVTLSLSNLGALGSGDPVNLERSVEVGGRLGGHYVQGHVDGVGRIAARHGQGKALLVRISAPDDVMRYVVERGFIAVDGASLTVMEVQSHSFVVSLVYHTQQNITLADLRIGAPVNLEVDVIAKYVERLVGRASSEINMDLIRRSGFA